MQISKYGSLIVFALLIVSIVLLYDTIRLQLNSAKVLEFNYMEYGIANVFLFFALFLYFEGEKERLSSSQKFSFGFVDLAQNAIIKSFFTIPKNSLHNLFRWIMNWIYLVAILCLLGYAFFFSPKNFGTVAGSLLEGIYGIIYFIVVIQLFVAVCLFGVMLFFHVRGKRLEARK